MLKAMAHRGPDGQGIHATDTVAIGHLRLAIIDIEGAPQPMWSPQKDVMLSYNGEVYNFPELMVEQQAAGWPFQTRSDTEVLLSRYIQQGTDFDAALNGMYAYAMLDMREGQGQVQIGIDPVGIKPLFICETPEAIIFASELQGIIAGLHSLGLPVHLNHDALAQYLWLGWVPAPGTLLQGVQKCVPGARMSIALGSGQVTRLSDRPLPASKRSRDLGETLDSCVKRHVIADAPLGFFLSGGIDSSLLVATAQRLGIQPNTFTVRFVGDGHGVKASDEADIAALVAKHCNARHHELEVSEESLVNTLDDTLIAMDQPINDPACLPLLMMSRFAREHVKVCLSGDGGDELFLGYLRHKYAGQKAAWRSVPAPLRAGARAFAHALPTAPGQGFTEKLRKLRVGFDLIDAPAYTGGPFAGAYADLIQHNVDKPTWAEDVPNTNDAMFEADMYGQLHGQMLPKSDHISMAASLECRVPFLDHQMIAAARAMSKEEKQAGRQGKAPLRSLLGQYLPAEVINRPKQGFRVPLTSWFRSTLADNVKSRLLDPAAPAAGLLSRSAVEGILSAHIRGDAEHSNRIWSLLALQSWLTRNGLDQSA